MLLQEKNDKTRRQKLELLIMRRFVYFPIYLKNKTESSFKEVINEERELQYFCRLVLLLLSY